MRKSRSFCLFLLTAAAMANTALGQGNDLNTFSNTEPIVRDEAAREQGKINVQNVVEELRQLLHKPSTALGKRTIMPPDEPTFVEIPDVDGKSTLIYFCRNTTANKMAQTLDAVCSNNGYVEYNSEQNKILVVDGTERMPVFRKAIAAIDTPAPQVLIEAKVVEVMITDDSQRNLSFSFNQREKGWNTEGEDAYMTGSSGFLNEVIGKNSQNSGAVVNFYPYATDNNNINVFFQWLLGAQDAKIISSPNITISRGDTATINTGQEIPIQEQSQNGSTVSFSTKYRNIGVTLRVTPKIINNNSVLLNINPEVSNVLQYDRITASNVSYQVPIISVRSIDTNLTVNNGQVIMMGGLFNTREVINEQRTPFLSDIPWVGELFTSKSNTKELVQLVFIMRATILSPEELLDGIIYDPQQQAQESLQLGDIIKDPVTFPPTTTTIEKVQEELENAPSMRDFKEDSANEEK